MSLDMMALLQILQLQSQETRAAMDAMYNQSQQAQAKQTQMVIDLVKTLAPGKGSGSPTLGSEGYVKKVDEKHFRKVPVFENKNPWREWRTHFLTAVRESYPELVDCLIRVESHEDPIPHEANLGVPGFLDGISNSPHQAHDDG